jgi:hypothetical protein
MTPLARCDRCRDLVVELWPVVGTRRRVEMRCALCAEGLALVPPVALQARLRERLAKVAATTRYLTRW